MHRIPQTLVIVAIVSGLPSLTLLADAILGPFPAWVAVVAVGLSLATAVWYIRSVAREQRILATRLIRVASDDGPVEEADMADLLFLHPIGHALVRLSRRLVRKNEVTERGRQSDNLIIEQLPDPLVVLAADRSVRRKNAAARAAYGDDMASVLRNPGLRAAIDRALSQRTTQTADLTLPVPIPREVQAIVVPVEPPLTDGGRLMVVLSDRTKERAVEQMRVDFVANVGHELRTPLAALIGFTETLRGSAAADPEAQTRFLAIMAEQGARMNRLIDDLLILSRIELTEHQRPSESVDIAQLATRVVASFEPRLKESGTQLLTDIATNIPAIMADPDQLVQVLHNLLDNAIKYGNPGGPVTLRVAPNLPSDPKLPARAGAVIEVIDRGAGIPKEHLPRITERFYRVDKGRSRAVGGTGLGLAIVKHIVSRHRGQLVIESEVGTGTTVRAWFPALQPNTDEN